MAAEDIMLGMRMSKGVSNEEVEIATLLLPDLPETLQQLKNDGFVIQVNERWQPTHKGWLFGNQLYGRILNLAP